MKKIIFLCPYFGSIPSEQLKLWAKTCSYNSKITWLLITDDKIDFELPVNVKILNMSLKELKNKIQSKFDFKISLENGYKLCDYKPLYGYIFSNLIKEYDYWGHCDFTDCIFGDIKKFLFDRIKYNPDKVGFLGHMTLYRNDEEVNKRFFIKTKSNYNLSEILGTNKNMGFDETDKYSINFVYLENNFDLKRIDDIYFDISPRYVEFKNSSWDDNFKNIGFNNNSYIVEWDNGKLFKVSFNNYDFIKEEIGYVHYQKRKIKYFINIDECNHFYLIPNEFINANFELTPKIFYKYTKHRILNINLFRIRYKRFITKLKNVILK